MLDLFSDIPLLSLFIKFMVASTLMFGTVWLLEKLRVLNTPDLAELAWKLAIAGTFLALLPMGNLFSNPITIEGERTSALVESFNEGRPFADFLDKPQGASQQNVSIPTPIVAPSMHAPATVKEAEQATSSRPEPNSTQAGLSVDQLEAATPSTSQERVTLSSTTGSSIIIPVTDSEEKTTKVVDPSGNLFASLAALRTQDIAIIIWSMLAAIAITLLVRAYVSAVHGLGSRVRVDAEGKANRTLRSICADVDIRHVPYLSRSSDIKSPICLPKREICLPDWAFDDMPEEELKSLLAHEVAHMLRRDPLMLMVLQILSRLFFFQPLFLLARKRLTDLAELAADEWAAKQLADARAVAAALYTCATKIKENRQIQWGLAMAGNKSMLRTRVERLVGSDTAPFKNAGLTAKSSLVAGMLTLTFGLPSIQFATALSAGDIHNGDTYTEVRKPRSDKDWNILAQQEVEELLKVNPLLAEDAERLAEELQKVSPNLTEEEAASLASVYEFPTVLDTKKFVHKPKSAEDWELLEKQKVESLEKVSPLSERDAQKLRDELQKISPKLKQKFATAFAKVSENAAAHPHEERAKEKVRAKVAASLPKAEEVWQQLQSDYEERRQKAIKRQQEQRKMVLERAQKKGWSPAQLDKLKERLEFSVQIPELETLVSLAEFKEIAMTAALIDYPHPFGDDTRNEIAEAIAEAAAEAETAVRMVEAEILRNAEHLERAGLEAGLVAAEAGLVAAEAGLREAGRRMHITDMDGSGSMIWSDNGLEIKVHWDGEFELASDERSIQRIDDEGQLVIRTKGDGPRRKIRFEGEDEKITIAYWIDGRKAAFDKTAQEWLGDTLIKLAREMGFNADKRVSHLLKKGGSDAVIKEMHQIKNDHVARIYTNHLLDQADLSDKQIGKLLNRLEKIDSDYEMRLALTNLFVEKKLNKKVLPRVLKAAKSIDSDYELRLLLSPYLEKFGVTDKTVRVILELAESMDSDYEMRLLLSAALKGKKLNQKNLEKFAELAANQIDSDYEKRLLFGVMATQYGNSKEATRIVVEALSTIDGDYERRLTLGMIVQHGAFDDNGWITVIEAAADIDGDYEKRLALSQIRNYMSKDKKVQKAFDEAIQTIDSDYERGRIAQARN